MLQFNRTNIIGCNSLRIIVGDPSVHMVLGVGLAGLLGLQVRIPPKALLSASCECCCQVEVYHSSTGILASVVGLSVIVVPRK